MLNALPASWLNEAAEEDKMIKKGIKKARNGVRMRWRLTKGGDNEQTEGERRWRREKEGAQRRDSHADMQLDEYKAPV